MADEPAPTPDAQPPKRGKKAALLIVAGIMAIEGVGVFFLTKFLSPPPPPAVAGEPEEGEEGTGVLGKPEKAEIQIAETHLTNKNGAKLSTVRIRVSGLVWSSDEDKAKELVEKNRSRIEDRISFVIRRASQQVLSEPDLPTIKRQIKHELDTIFGDETVLLEIMIPQLLQS